MGDKISKNSTSKISMIISETDIPVLEVDIPSYLTTR
jgi:hypothetical protein